ncbi:hypothetical protein [Leptolyngbya sp. FACHB-261]|uniref:hypothetical protein n=1 Tax=Leptolyngbya sp. FACHB-261 TaxID=2692806 RepID=UPI0016870E6A|nr:hypothetical protein [Leptolyngbya sp. FACHB-261]MBD2105118.1 hypothetical protein [Leptolyngbya sp. FACHB-261]
MLPTVIPEQLVRPFSFYHEGKMQGGMSHGNQLYWLVCSFEMQKRAGAYNLGCKLAHQGGQVMITVSSSQYRVWADMHLAAQLQSLERRSSLENAAKPERQPVALGSRA